MPEQIVSLADFVRTHRNTALARRVPAWDETTEAAFLDSLCRGLPTPAFVFASPTTSNDDMTIVDGIKRLWLLKRVAEETNHEYAYNPADDTVVRCDKDNPEHVPFSSLLWTTGFLKAERRLLDAGTVPEYVMGQLHLTSRRLNDQKILSHLVYNADDERQTLLRARWNTRA